MGDAYMVRACEPLTLQPACTVRAHVPTQTPFLTALVAGGAC